MIPVLTTTIILLLRSSLYQTNADGHVTSNVTSGGVNVKARVRSTREASQCQDQFQTLLNEQFSESSGGLRYAEGDVKSEGNCSDWCMKIPRCVGAVFSYWFTELGRHTSCTYSDDNATLTLKPSTSNNDVYYGVIYRCPKHYRCSDAPCQNGATCINAKAGGRGVTCVCADSWKSWFCEKRQTCLDHKCQNGATCRYSEKVGITCLCPAGYEGFYCQWPVKTTAMGNSTGWSPKTKTLVAVGVAAGVAATGVASAAVIGAAASTAAGTAATTAGTTAATSGGANVEVGSKEVSSTTASFGKKLFGGVRKKRDSNDEVEKDANASITEASIADSFYNLVKDLVAAEDNKSASVLSTSVKSTSGK